jgi:hypothetical protein
VKGSRGIGHGIRMGDVWKAGRKEVACGCRRLERAPQANELNRSAQLNTPAYPKACWVYVDKIQ